MNQSCHAYECVISHTWIGRVTQEGHESCDAYERVMNKSRHAYEWVMSHRKGMPAVKSHISVRHITHTHVSHHTYTSVMSHVWMSHITQEGHVSCHAYEWVINKSRHAYEWVMSHRRGLGAGISGQSGTRAAGQSSYGPYVPSHGMSLSTYMCGYIWGEHVLTTLAAGQHSYGPNVPSHGMSLSTYMCGYIWGEHDLTTLAAGQHSYGPYVPSHGMSLSVYMCGYIWGEHVLKTRAAGQHSYGPYVPSHGMSLSVYMCGYIWEEHVLKTQVSRQPCHEHYVCSHSMCHWVYTCADMYRKNMFSTRPWLGRLVSQSRKLLGDPVTDHVFPWQYETGWVYTYKCGYVWREHVLYTEVAGWYNHGPYVLLHGVSLNGCIYTHADVYMENKFSQKKFGDPVTDLVFPYSM